MGTASAALAPQAGDFSAGGAGMSLAPRWGAVKAAESRTGEADGDRVDVPVEAVDDAFDRMVAGAIPAVVEAALIAKRPRLYRLVVARVELPLLRHVLAVCGGNQLRAARLLGVNRNTLRKRLRALGLLPPAPTHRALP